MVLGIRVKLFRGEYGCVRQSTLLFLELVQCTPPAPATHALLGGELPRLNAALGPALRAGCGCFCCCV